MSWIDAFDLSPADRALLDRVAASDTPLPLDHESTAGLQAIARLHGIEWATALLFHRLLTDRPPTFDPRFDNTRLPTPLLHVLIVPGAFHRHHQRHTDADGSRVARIAERLGWSWEVLDVPSLGTRTANAAALCDRLRALRHRPTLIASLSTGSADVATALRAPAAFADVRAWVDISGMARGTALIDVLAKPWWRKLGVSLLLRIKGSSWSTLETLRRERLGSPIVLPAHVRAFHLIAFPLRHQLRHPWAAKGYDRLSPLGPTDGGGNLLGDCVMLPGEILPLWGVDHYCRPAWSLDDWLERLFRHATQSASIASTIPASRSNA
jgi:hypothetical protein